MVREGLDEDQQTIRCRRFSLPADGTIAWESIPNSCATRCDGASVAKSRDLAALAHVPAGSRIAAFAPETICAEWPFSGHDHLASLAIGRRSAFVNTQWDIPGASWMRPIYNRGRGYNDETSTKLASSRFPACYGPKLIDRLDHLPRDRFDYVWTFDEPVSVSRYPWLRPRSSGPSGTLYAIEG
ncbi:MAG: hypothetical protein ABR588_03725 [Sphingomicrobium sp.]